jgi:F-type H+-transporting ATPase subunit b
MALLLLALLQEHGAPAGGDAHVATPFDINTGLIFWTLIVFGILLVMLWRFAWPTIVKTVEERERRIAKQLADAEQANAQAQKLLEEHKAAMAQARAEAQDLIGRAKTVAQKERDVLLAKAHEEQDQILERARREIGAERDKAIVALRREAVELSIAAASKLLEANLDSDANRKLVTEYLAGLEGKA